MYTIPKLRELIENVPYKPPVGRLKLQTVIRRPYRIHVIWEYESPYTLPKEWRSPIVDDVEIIKVNPHTALIVLRIATPVTEEHVPFFLNRVQKVLTYILG